VSALRRRLDGVVTCDMDSDLLLLDAETDQIHQLNATATFIWRHVEEAPSPELLAGLLVDAFEVDEQVALRDVFDTLTRFSALKLVEVG
jgi:hypothetical protein